MKKIFFLLCVVLALAGCGKKGDPIPQDQKNAFTWGKTSAAFAANGCLMLSGIITGAATNVDGFSLELEPLDALNNTSLPPELQTHNGTCEGCPFTPREFSEVTPQETLKEKEGTRFSFVYCPANKAPGYRWRLVARNVFRAFPYALSPLGIVRQP